MPRRIGTTSFPLTKRFDKEITITDYFHDGSTYGNSIIVENYSGTERWRLAHLEGFSKDLWLFDEVEAGEYAGKLGRTGEVSGAHLHVSLKYKIGGKWIFANPASRLDLENV